MSALRQQQPALSQPQELGIDEGKVLLRGLTEGQRDQIRRDGVPLGPRTEGRSAGKYARHWRRKDGLYNVVLEVTPAQNAVWRQLAKDGEWAREKRVKIAPYLTPLGRALRRQMQSRFDSLWEQGLKPRWQGVCGIVCQRRAGSSQDSDRSSMSSGD